MATIYTEEFSIDTLQVTNHIKFANLRAGINDAKATQRQFDKAQRDGGAAWRGARPPRNFRPRVARFAYPPRGVSAADAASLMDERVLYQAGGGKVRLGARETSEGTRVVNQAARHLFDMVSFGEEGDIITVSLGEMVSGLWLTYSLFLGLSILQDPWLGWGGRRGAAVFG